MDENELNNENPEAGLEPIAEPGGLTIAQYAVLTKAKCPIMTGEVSDVAKNLVAIYLLSMSSGKAYALAKGKGDDELEALAVEWASSMPQKEYQERVSKALDDILRFWNLIPRAEADKDGGKKKDTETDSSPSLSNGPAAPTDGDSGKSATEPPPSE